MKYKMKEVIVEQIINVLQSDDIIDVADIKKIGDNIDQQIQNVIICGISTMNKVYPMTQDYEYKLDIAIRSWIADDESGENFQNLCNLVESVLSPLNDAKEFGIILSKPVVGVVNEGQTRQVTEDSNILTFSYLVYVSF